VTRRLSQPHMPSTRYNCIVNMIDLSPGHYFDGSELTKLVVPTGSTIPPTTMYVMARGLHPSTIDGFAIIEALQKVKNLVHQFEITWFRWSSTSETGMTEQSLSFRGDSPRRSRAINIVLLTDEFYRSTQGGTAVEQLRFMGIDVDPPAAQLRLDSLLDTGPVRALPDFPDTIMLADRDPGTGQLRRQFFKLDR
jgi:hypothetical protein